MKKRRFSVSLSAITVLSVTAAAAAAVSVCCAVFASVYSNALLRDASVRSEQLISQTEFTVNSYLENMKNRLFMIHGIAKKSSSAAEFEERISALTYIQNDIYAVTVYGENGEIISCTGSGGKFKQTVLKDLSFDKSFLPATENFTVSPPHVQTLFENEYPWVVTMIIKPSQPLFGGGAYIAADCLFTDIASLIDSVGVGAHGYCFVTDKDGSIVYHPQQQLLFSGLKTEDTSFIPTLSDGFHNEKNKIYTVKTTDTGLWRIIGISFTDELATERRTQIIISVAVSFFCCAVIALFAVWIYSKIVSGPVRSLIREMRRFEKEADSFSYSGGDESVTELKIISDTFGHMSAKIKELMEQVRREETALRKTELKALQAQINPHFLYNTLDSIQWMCEQGKTADAAKMVSALAKLFRISISRGRELITIGDEMRHAESYLIIQSFRYRDQFSYRFDVDPELTEFLCNKITVQPFIENAIYHGLDRTVDDGEITVSVKSAGDDILIMVKDNGIGMTKEQCDAILNNEQNSKSGIGGIGVKNVNDRLKIYFGEKYGITIESELDEGTEVKILIPKIRSEKEAEK